MHRSIVGGALGERRTLARVLLALVTLVTLASGAVWPRVAHARRSPCRHSRTGTSSTRPASSLRRTSTLSDHRQLEATRLQTGYVIDALVAGSLEGASIDDVAFQTFQTWKPGDAKRDNGVLIVVAPNRRQDRIEVGKGVEGALTDLQTDGHFDAR